MSDNCYSKKQTRGEYIEQENRLTNRHIQALGLMQDLHRENEETKKRMGELEKELEKCAEFHSIARDAQAFKKKAQEDCLKQIDRNNERLTRKHKEEVMSLVSAKLQAETDWLEERERLQALIAQHEKQNAELTEQLESLKKHDLKVDVVNQRLDQSLKEMVELKANNSQLHLQIQHLQEQGNAGEARLLDRIQELEQEKGGLEERLKEAEQRVKELELRGKVMETELNTASTRNEERASTAKSRLKEQLDKAAKDLQGYQQRVSELEGMVSELVKELQEKGAELEQESSTKEKLLMLLQQLQEECNALREALAATQQRKTQGTPERVGFREFVQMRRDMNNLKEENDWLKLNMRKPKSLPSLKGLSPDGHPQSDLGHHRNQRTTAVKQAKSETALQVYRK